MSREREAIPIGRLNPKVERASRRWAIPKLQNLMASGKIADYLATLKNTEERTLADLIAFSIEHCSTEMRYFGQEIFELAHSQA